jgi:hypothetical protein
METNKPNLAAWRTAKRSNSQIRPFPHFEAPCHPPQAASDEKKCYGLRLAQTFALVFALTFALRDTH